MKKRILVCGGTGFLGRNIAKRLADSGEYQVYATYFKRKPWHHSNLEWYNVDLTDKAMTDSIINKMDVVIQAAAVTSGCQDTFARPYIHVTDNAVMNAYIMRAAHERKVGHVIFFSCSTMYGDGNCTEETPINPHPRYFGMVNTKLYNEKMCAFYAGLGETKFTVVRGSNFYGPYDKFDLDRAHVFGATITKVAQAKDKIDVWGDGRESRDLLYIDDLVDFVERALKKQEKSYALYNVGYGSSTSIGDLALKIIKASGKAIDVNYITDKPSIPVSVSLNCAKAKNEFGWEPKTSIEDGIKKTVDWHRDNFVNPVSD